MPKTSFSRPSSKPFAESTPFASKRRHVFPPGFSASASIAASIISAGTKPANPSWEKRPWSPFPPNHPEPIPWRPAVPDAATSRTISPAAEQLILSRYFEDVKPVLLDYAHDGTRARNEELLLTDREIARSLLIQNLLLKRALARKNPALAELLDDLDLILTEIANLQSQDAATPASLKDVIGQRQVLSRIRSLEKI